MSFERPQQPRPRPKPHTRPQSPLGQRPRPQQAPSRSQPLSRSGDARATVRLRGPALGDRDTAYFAPRMGDWLLLGILVAIFLGNGVWVWHSMGTASHAGRAIFFGLLLLCVLWAALVYTFKLSVCVRVGPHGISVVRGPWRTELAWRDVARLTERSQLREGQRFRWLVALARDGRRMQIRDDMVLDYQRFRVEVYERYRLWNDHGGTWGTTGGGPYSAREMLPGQTTWWAVGAVALGLPGIYFWALLPETNPLGWALLAAGVVCGAMSARGALRRQSYTVDGKTITVRRPFVTLRLAWSEVARVERTRTAFGGVIRVGIAVGQVALKVAARTDGRVESFDWTPRIPEYLVLRGAGHLARIRLHRLERPDEMLAWVEFYDNVAQHAAESAPRRTGAPAPAALAALAAPLPEAEQPADLSAAAGPVDPWGAGRGGETEGERRAEESRARMPERPEWPETPAAQQEPAAPTMPTIPPMPTAPTEATPPGESWLRAEPWRPGEVPGWQAQPERPQTHMPQAQAQAPREWERPAQQEQAPWVQAAPSWGQHGQAHAQAQQQGQWGQPAQEAPGGTAEARPTPQGTIEEGMWRRRSTAGPAASESWRHEGAKRHEAERPVWPAEQPEWPQSRWPQPESPVGREQAASAPRMGGPSGPAEGSGAGYGEWSDEEEPEGAEDAPTSSSENLAESFAAWREDANWQRPPLPRFGPERGPGQSGES